MTNLIVESNFEMAYNNIPELLFKPDMIYVNGKFNDNNIKLFIDTGASSSVLSLDTVKKLGLYEYIDFSYNGIAVGIGTNKIIGRIHYIEIQVDDYIIPISVNVLENSENFTDFDILIGLNVLYANGIIIDTRNKCLLFNNNKIKY